MSASDIALPAVDTAAVDTAVVDTPTTTETEVSTQELTEVKAEVTDTKAEPTEGTEDKSTESGTKALPSAKEIHETLKRFHGEATAEGKPLLAKLNSQIRDVFQELKASKAGLAELKQSTADLQELRDTIQSVEESDALLYEGSPELVANIVSDLKEAGRLEALGKLGAPFLDAVKQHAPEQYLSEIQRPLFLQTMEETGLTNSLNEVHSLLTAGKPAEALKVLSNVGEYMNNLQDEHDQHGKGKAALQTEQAKFTAEKSVQQSAESKAFNVSVAKSAEGISNKILGGALAPILKQAYFKGYSKESLQPLGDYIKTSLHQALKSDGEYQKGMARLFKVTNPDRAAIEQLHRDTVNRLAKDIVAKSVRQMHPGYKPAVKPTAKVAPKAVAPNKPGQAIMVAKKPPSDQIDWSHKDAQILAISGRAYLKDGRYIQWRRN